MTHPPATGNPHDGPPRHATIAKGAVINILGSCGKVLIPVYFILITRLFGPAAMGIYYLAYIAIDIALTLTVSGFNDGIILYCSRYADNNKDEAKFYRTLANGLLFSMMIAITLVVGCHSWGLDLIRGRYPQPGFLETVQIMSLAIPFSVLTTVVIAATKSQMTMKWDALFSGFLRPLLLIFFTLLAIALGDNSPGSGLSQLALGYLATSMVMAIAALAVYGRFFSYAKLILAFRNFRLEKGLLTFVMPQNLNRTFNTFITNLDVLMLGYFGIKAELVGLYGIGAQIVRNIREIKLAFSGSYSPIIVRQHIASDADGMSTTMTTVSRWIISIALPVALVIGLLRQDLLLLFHASFVTDSSFMLLLLVPPLLSCSFGLAGNIVVMSGHSLVNLGNSLLVASCNFLLNVLFIPRFGLMGAAAATVLASAFITVLQLIEARYLLGVGVLWRMLLAPYLAAVPAGLILVVWHIISPASALPLRIAGALLAVIVYAAALYPLTPDQAYRQAVAAVLVKIFKPRAR